ncbi:hypothetical protein HDIA_2655 [Hartmannibacter diazotrophicus]|uniref:Uncharacterized protein n=1 Tax=Hartmannibacter diazotrophicus TaxID=1482074 RepID=A0A2C9D7E3_9HYPH|nr:hypothetical protein [Hartmannibacter diazotrophicus]SON56196.1 hypothetical protein HDIA_2655 [Hartmannibacter diazotrophicus]
MPGLGSFGRLEFGKLGFNTQRRAPTANNLQHNINIITSAIASRHRLSAKINGSDTVLEPYALFTSASGTILNAVVIFSDVLGVASFMPQNINVATMHAVKEENDGFFPNWGFDLSGLTDATEVLASVDLIQYPKDGFQSDPGAVTS